MKKQPAATAVRLVAAQAADWPAISALLVAAQLPLDGALDHLPGFIVAFRNSDLIGSAGWKPMDRWGCCGQSLLRKRNAAAALAVN